MGIYKYTVLMRVDSSVGFPDGDGDGVRIDFLCQTRRAPTSINLMF